MAFCSLIQPVEVQSFSPKRCALDAVIKQQLLTDINVSCGLQQDDIPLSFREVHPAIDWPQVCLLGGMIDPPAHGVFCWVTPTRESLSIYAEVPTTTMEKEKVVHLILDGLHHLPALCSCDYLAMVIANNGSHGKGFGGNNSCGQKKVQLVFTPGAQYHSVLLLD